MAIRVLFCCAVGAVLGGCSKASNEPAPEPVPSATPPVGTTANLPDPAPARKSALEVRRAECLNAVRVALPGFEEAVRRAREAIGSLESRAKAELARRDAAVLAARSAHEQGKQKLADANAAVVRFAQAAATAKSQHTDLLLSGLPADVVLVTAARDLLTALENNEKAEEEITAAAAKATTARDAYAEIAGERDDTAEEAKEEEDAKKKELLEAKLKGLEEKVKTAKADLDREEAVLEAAKAKRINPAEKAAAIRATLGTDIELRTPAAMKDLRVALVGLLDRKQNPGTEVLEYQIAVESVRVADAAVDKADAEYREANKASISANRRLKRARSTYDGARDAGLRGAALDRYADAVRRAQERANSANRLTEVKKGELSDRKKELATAKKDVSSLKRKAEKMLAEDAKAETAVRDALKPHLRGAETTEGRHRAEVQAAEQKAAQAAQQEQESREAVAVAEGKIGALADAERMATRERDTLKAVASAEAFATVTGRLERTLDSVRGLVTNSLSPDSITVFRNAFRDLETAGVSLPDLSAYSDMNQDQLAARSALVAAAAAARDFRTPIEMLDVEIAVDQKRRR